MNEYSQELNKRRDSARKRVQNNESRPAYGRLSDGPDAGADQAGTVLTRAVEARTTSSGS
jgi:hypothetical protein